MTVRRGIRYGIAGVLVLYGLYLARLHSYLLFHCLAEVFSVVVACAIFTIFWHTRRFLESGYFPFLGIGYLFVGIFDLMHALTYRGVGIFQDGNTNLSMQLWISARYVQSLSFLLAPFFLRRRLGSSVVFAAYMALSTLVLLAIFPWHAFPLCFTEDEALTPFKTASEYAVCVIFLGAGVTLVHRRSLFDPRVLRLVRASLGMMIATGLAATWQTGVFGLPDLIGHYLKIVSFYLIYRAFIHIGLTRPYSVLFRSLKQSEEALRDSEERYRAIVETANDGIWTVDADYRTTFVNQKMADLLGYSVAEMLGKPVTDFDPDLTRSELEGLVHRRRQGAREQFERKLQRKDGSDLWVRMSAAPLLNDQQQFVGACRIVTDISDLRRTIQALRESRDMLERRVQERTAELRQSEARLLEAQRIAT